MTYTLEITRRARKQLGGIDASARQHVLSAIRGLAYTPRPQGSKKLTGREGWRIRVGRYRVIYEIRDNRLAVLVISVGHRRDVYR